MSENGLMEQQFERVINVLGREALQCLQNSTVLIAGLGGVGSYAVEAVVRSGIGRVILCDYDKVEYSNLNRQLEATHLTLGENKTDAMEKRVLAVNPDCKVIKKQFLIDESTIDELFDSPCDYVIDAIDDMNAKILLWKKCQQLNIPFVASLGMARRLDPTRLTVTTLNKTTDDPMARKLRYLAKKQEMDLNIKVIWSSEQPLPLMEDGVLGSMIFVPAAAGLACGKTCIEELISR